MITCLLLLGACIVSSAFSEAKSSTPASRTPVIPSHESVVGNAARIFNAIHSAGRQWGSSLNHNGFGFFPAVVTKGTLLYHGSRSNLSPSEPQWLAFEVEHAETFAVSRKCSIDDGHPLCKGKDKTRSSRVLSNGQKPIALEHLNDDEEWNTRGYLHTYHANRNLNVLYVDGMGAAKSKSGTLDSQDLVLRENKTGSWDNYMDEYGRANDICEMITDWGYDGFMRVEIGFELVQCDFSNGLDLITATRTLLPADQLGTEDLHLFQLARTVARGYDGLGADRAHLDFSSMVSGFFFPINVSNTDPERPDLIRLAAAKLEELKDIKSHLRKVSLQPRRFTVNWQAIVDLIVDRFSDRLALMASGKLSLKNFVTELDKATLTYVDAPPLPEDIDQEQDRNRLAEAIARCSDHYLTSALLVRDSWSHEDELIHTAVKHVARDLCTTLLETRSYLHNALRSKRVGDNAAKVTKRSAEFEWAMAVSQRRLRDLTERLDWTSWKRVLPCPIDEVWFVSMYPYGTDEDHWHPGCRTMKEMKPPRIGYSDLDYFLRTR